MFFFLLLDFLFDCSFYSNINIIYFIMTYFYHWRYFNNNLFIFYLYKKTE